MTPYSKLAPLKLLDPMASRHVFSKEIGGEMKEDVIRGVLEFFESGVFYFILDIHTEKIATKEQK